MKHLQNNRGGALIVTLVVLTFASLFAGTVAASTTTASHQISTTGENVDARLVSESGVDFYLNRVDRAVDEQVLATVADFEVPDGVENHKLDDHHRFSIKDVNTTTNGSTMIVHFTSVGYANGEKQSISEQVTIDRNERGDYCI